MFFSLLIELLIIIFAEREIQNYKYKCIKCGREGKMNFEIGPNQLKVSCPVANNPCDLFININTDKVENYYNYYDKTKKTLEVLKEEKSGVLSAEAVSEDTP